MGQKRECYPSSAPPAPASSATLDPFQRCQLTPLEANAVYRNRRHRRRGPEEGAFSNRQGGRAITSPCPANCAADLAMLRNSRCYSAPPWDFVAQARRQCRYGTQRSVFSNAASRPLWKGVLRPSRNRRSSPEESVRPQAEGDVGQIPLHALPNTSPIWPCRVTVDVSPRPHGTLSGLPA